MAKWLLAFGAGGCWSGYPLALVLDADTREEAQRHGFSKSIEATLEERRRGHGTSYHVEEIKTHYRDTALYQSWLKPSARIMLAHHYPDPAPEIPATGRYIVGEWAHIFPKRRGMSTVRLAFDKQTRRIVAMQKYGESGYKEASSADVADVEDSIVNANAEAIDNPADFGLELTDALPIWALIMEAAH
jgi:hypothetical protein